MSLVSRTFQASEALSRIHSRSLVFALILVPKPIRFVIALNVKVVSSLNRAAIASLIGSLLARLANSPGWQIEPEDQTTGDAG